MPKHFLKVHANYFQEQLVKNVVTYKWKRRLQYVLVFDDNDTLIALKLDKVVA